MSGHRTSFNSSLLSVILLVAFYVDKDQFTILTEGDPNSILLFLITVYVAVCSK